MTILTRADFARHLGVNRSTVTRWAERGHLVLAGDGDVDLEASLARLADTTGIRPDVAARHAAERAKASAPESAPAGRAGGDGGDGGDPPDGTQRRAGESRTEAQARKESAAADLLEIELALKRGNLYEKEKVEAIFSDLGASIRSRLGNGPDQIAPVVAPVTDLDEVHALESEHHRTMLQGMVDDIQSAKKRLASGYESGS